MRRNRAARKNVANLRKQLAALVKEAEKLGLFDENNGSEEKLVEGVLPAFVEDQKLNTLESSLVE